MTARLIKALAPRAVVFGVATEFCVQAACLGLRQHEVRTVLVYDAIRALTAQGEKQALRIMRQAGVEFTTVDTLLGSGSN